MEKFKIGVIGVGGICQLIHLPAIKSLSNVEVVALCDIVESKMDIGDTILGYTTAHFTDYNKLLELKLDAIHICLPNYLHSIVAVAALNRGINVFCEKPDAVSVDEAQKMKNAAEKSKKCLMVMRNNRHNGASKIAKSYIDEGKAGEIYCGRCGWLRRRGIPGKGGWFTTKEQSGGGPLIDLGVHLIDLSIYLMGNPTPVSVSGCTYNKFANSDISDSAHSQFGEKTENGIFDVEDLAMGFVRFNNGACLQIEFSWASNIEKETRFVELRGEKAGFSIEGGVFKMFGEQNGNLVDTVNTSFSEEGHGANIQHFYNVLSGKEKPDYEPIQGLNIIKILQAIYESAKTGKEVRL